MKDERVGEEKNGRSRNCSCCLVGFKPALCCHVAARGRNLVLPAHARTSAHSENEQSTNGNGTVDAPKSTRREDKPRDENPRGWGDEMIRRKIC